MFEEPSGSHGLGSLEDPVSIPVQDFSQHHVSRRKSPTPCDNRVSGYTKDPQTEQNNSPLDTSTGFLQPYRSTEKPQSPILDDKDGNNTGSGQGKAKRIRQGGDYPYNIKDSDAGGGIPANWWKKANVAYEHITPSHIRGPGCVVNTQSGTGNIQPQAGHGHRLSTVDDECNQDSQDTAMAPSALVDSAKEWPYECITGKEVIDGEDYFWIRWDETLIPRSSLRNSEQLIKGFEARCQTQLKAKRAPRRRRFAQSKQAATGTDITPQKKQRGRPRKQV